MKKALRWFMAIPVAAFGFAGVALGLVGLGLIAASLKLLEALDRLD